MSGRAIFVENWDAGYGSAYRIDPDDFPEEAAVLEEDGSALRAHPVAAAEVEPLAFVDGVRRGEAWLYQEDPVTGAPIRGLAGAYACGSAVLRRGARTMEFGECLVRRHVVWDSGERSELPAVAGGWAWEPAFTAATEPDAPLRELQRMMRQSEGRLADSLAEQGYLTVVDGTLHTLRRRQLPLVGLVKTHHRTLLDVNQHRRVPNLAPAQRTSIFRLGKHRYSAYLRIAPRESGVSPWAGIVRLEAPRAGGLEAARESIDRAAGCLPRFAGIAHRDPRAPQNLQPIFRLEQHLRHLLGDAGLAARAVRQAVAGAARGERPTERGELDAERAIA